MKSVLISIKPKWCELIASGKKTIEVRKTRPQIECPFKCYIYCSAGEPLWLTLGKTVMSDKAYNRIIDDIPILLNQKVIGEFACYKIIEVDCDSVAPFEYQTKDYIEDKICFGRDELIKYAGFTRPFGWHISDLLIYCEPKELIEFKHCGANYHYNPVISRPPQSWCYVEELR